MKWSYDISSYGVARYNQRRTKKCRAKNKSLVNTTNTWMLLMVQFDFWNVHTQKSVIVTFGVVSCCRLRFIIFQSECIYRSSYHTYTRTLCVVACFWFGRTDALKSVLRRNTAFRCNRAAHKQLQAVVYLLVRALVYSGNEPVSIKCVVYERR